MFTYLTKYKKQLCHMKFQFYDCYLLFNINTDRIILCLLKLTTFIEYKKYKVSTDPHSHTGVLSQSADAQNSPPLYYTIILDTEVMPA